MRVRIKQHHRKDRIEIVCMRPTIEVFHWSVLQKNPRVQPLIQQYFGELGAEVCTLLCAEKGDPYFHTWGGHNILKHSSGSAVVLYLGPSKGSLDFEKQVNAISWAEMLSEEEPFSKQKAIEQPYDTKGYIQGRPYRFIFRNDREIMLAAGLINCALCKHDNSSQRKQYDLKNADLYGMREYLEACGLQVCSNGFEMYTKSIHLYIEEFYKSIGNNAFEAAMERFFDVNQFSFKTNRPFLENRKYWRRLVSRLEAGCQKCLERTLVHMAVANDIIAIWQNFLKLINERTGKFILTYYWGLSRTFEFPEFKIDALKFGKLYHVRTPGFFGEYSYFFEEQNDELMMYVNLTSHWQWHEESHEYFEVTTDGCRELKGDECRALTDKILALSRENIKKHIKE